MKHFGIIKSLMRMKLKCTGDQLMEHVLWKNLLYHHVLKQIDNNATLPSPS